MGRYIFSHSLCAGAFVYASKAALSLNSMTIAALKSRGCTFSVFSQTFLMPEYSAAIFRTPSSAASFCSVVAEDFHCTVITCSTVAGVPNLLAPARTPAPKTATAVTTASSTCVNLICFIYFAPEKCSVSPLWVRMPRPQAAPIFRQDDGVGGIPGVVPKINRAEGG